MNLRLQALLFFGTRSLPFPHEMEAKHSPLSLTAREPLLPSQRARVPDSTLRGGKLKPATLQVAPEALLHQGTQKPSTSHCTSLQESHFSPVQELKSQLLYWVAICYSAGAKRPAPRHSAQRPNAPHCNCRRTPAPPSKNRNSSPHVEARKEVISPTFPCKE
jgi:hypothetical protein